MLKCLICSYLAEQRQIRTWVSCNQFRALVHRLQWFAEQFLKYGYWNMQWESESLYQDVLQTGKCQKCKQKVQEL